MTALMRSPHTIGLYDFGVADNGIVYYVMELLEGLDLVDLVTRYGPVPSERAIHLLRQVCDSLAEAHQQGLIHRDIKAANIYLCRYGRNVDFVKVLDFGLVTLRQDWRAQSSYATGELQVGGTPAYMSPEQVEGGQLDSRSDLYSVGCVGYWLLTGCRVFEGSSAMATMIHHHRTPPVPPSQRSELPISPQLEAVILRCLAKDPEQRPQSADELDRLLQDAESEPRWTPERATRWWQEHRPEAASTGPAGDGGLVRGVSLQWPRTSGAGTVATRDAVAPLPW
jgi:serine/threonine-protein kinase